MPIIFQKSNEAIASFDFDYPLEKKVLLMKKMIPFILGSFLLLSATACSENTDTNVATDGEGVRSDQIESDARAREDRDGTNSATDGNPRTAEDVAVDIRNSLENNLPGSRLAVDVDGENGKVTVDGTVQSQEQFDEIKPLVMAFEGIQSVDVKAEVKSN